ncbi:DNA topoisomerase IV [Tamlana agarivorans]|uniref:DNA topoisomerase IV n=1 Tax=Pseudotamlana agarivorans TaxID=481183 RepID=A0ACC5UCD0_9FLAO|nr:DNA topoisomerase IV [Tamlana agarivorans]MBU2951986.1 DNA topoisomerase IV [Tamlana agarivorans]
MRFLPLILLFVLCSCYEKARDCKPYQIGEFYSEVTIDGVVFKSTFKRDKNIQVEKYDKKIDSSNLRWINDCEVVFKTINPKNMAERKDIHLKILTTTDSSYTYEYSYVGETKKQQGTAYIMN